MRLERDGGEIGARPGRGWSEMEARLRTVSGSRQRREALVSALQDAAASLISHGPQS